MEEQNTTPSPMPEQKPEQKNEQLADPGIQIKPAPVPDQKKELTPEEKAARKKLARKRAGFLLGGLYLLLLLGSIFYGVFVGPKPFSLFDYLPLSQAGFNRFVMMLFNGLAGLIVVGSMLATLFFMLKSFLLKKEKVQEKRASMKKAMFSGIGFFVLAALWLTGIWFLGPRLIVQERFESPILTDPEKVINLTAPVDITFDGSAIPIDTKNYEILSYTWSFGDGSGGNGQIVSHRYTQKAKGDGLYTVTLTVDYMNIKSGELLEAEFTKDVGIKNELVAADFTMAPTGGPAPLDVTFDASGSYDPDGEIIAFDWDMDGDGKYDDEEGEIVDYTFTQEGSFEIGLRVTDNNGEYDFVIKTLEVGVGGLKAVITSTVPEGEKYFLGERYNFTGDQSSAPNDETITKYRWNFGDGTTVQSRSTSHTWEEEGVYEVLLTVEDPDGNSHTDSLVVEVVDPGTKSQAVITTSPVAEGTVLEGPVPFTVDFDGTNSLDPDEDIIDYQWDFDNDGTIDDTGENVSFTYQEVGNYEARLLVIDSEGHTSETTLDINVVSQGIIARLDVDVTNGEVPLVVQFDAAASTYQDGNIVSYEYDFGDGSEGHVGGSDVSYRYTTVGTFTASVTVIADDGATDTTSVQVVVRPVSLTACFTLNLNQGDAPLFVTVEPSCSTGTVQSYEWNFGDGEGVSFDRQPEPYLYEEPGIYTIRLEVTGDNGIVDVFEQDITVN